MSDDSRANIIVDGEISPLKQKMREAADELKRFGNEGETIFRKMTGPLGSLQEKFVAVSAILAGGKVFADAVEQAAKFTEESLKLGDGLGVSATQASTFITALEDVDVTQEQFVAAAQGMAKQLKTNEEGLQAMGLKTRDAAGQLRPLNTLVVEGIEVVNGYKAGTDRAIAGQVAFGKGFQLTGNLLKLNSETLAENAALQERLGILVGQENVEAWKAYDSAGDKAHLTLKAFGVTIGNAVMPVLTDLANWFSAIGPAAITIVRGAIGGLVASFHFLTTGVTVLWETLNAMVVTVAEPIRALGEAISRALSGDWAGAKESVKAIGTNISGAWGQAMDQMQAKAQSTRDRVWSLFAEGTPAAAPSTDGRSAGGLVDQPKEKKPRKETEQSVMQYYEAALASEKALAAEKDALREYSKAQELEFWRTIQQNAVMSEKDRIAVERKVATLSVEVKREAARQQAEISQENDRSAQERALAKVDAEQAAADALLATDQITQQQALSMEQGFEQRRYVIKRSALQDRLAMYEADPDLNPVEAAKLKNQLLELEQQYQIKKVQMQGKFIAQQQVETAKSTQLWQSLGQTMSGLWDKGITAMMQGTFKWRNALKTIGVELVGWFASNVVGAMVKQWLLGKAAEFAISMGWMTKEQAMKLGFLQAGVAAQATGTAETLGIKAAEATGVSAANAVEAGSGAAASQASIPYVGPILALAAMAAVFAAVSGLSKNIKSASKGYDIPKGVNPMVQAHEEEMVLPARQANVIRSLADGETTNRAPSSPAVHMHVHTQSPKDFESFLRSNSHTITPALRRLARNFTSTSRW